MDRQKNMKIRVEQLNPTIGDIGGNSGMILNALEKAEEDGIELLVLPEMILTGYPVQDLLENEYFREYCYKANQEIIDKTVRTALLFGTLTPNPSGIGRKMFNSAILCRNGQVLGRADKTLLPTYDIFDDLRYFEPGSQIRCLNLGEVKLGVTICEDIWYNENEVQYHYYDVNPAEELKALGARAIINISASPYTKSKHENRLQMLRNHTDSLNLPVFYSNQTGAQTEVLFDGDSMVMDANGKIVAITEPFEPGYVDVDWSPGTGRVKRIENQPDPVKQREAAGYSEPESGKDKQKPAREDKGRPVIPASEEIGVPSHPVRPEGWREDVDSSEGKSGLGQLILAQPSKGVSDHHRLFKAMLTGIQDYLCKTGISGQVILGLSGGIDSALVAVLAAEAVGSRNVTALMMPGDFSSAGSIEDSETLAENLGINHRKMPITNLYKTYLDTLAPLFEGTEFGVAEENVQSRIRGALLMACSNKFGPMLLSTGNKSELAVGYATLYGDMNGGLNPIGDLYKTEVFQLCRWLNREYYKKEVIPNEILEKPPSAELRPDQKDTDSLPEYEILDDILWRYIDLQQESERITKEGGHDGDVVRWILKLVDYNEFKRFQAPPILKLSSKSFGTGRRWPLVQSWTGHNR